jgi:hypothetical protein
VLLELLCFPVSVPLLTLRFSLEQARAVAEQELLDEAPVREALLLLHLEREEGEITEEQYVEQEALLMQRLQAIRAYREQVEGSGSPAVPIDEVSHVDVELHDDLRGPIPSSAADTSVRE